MIKRTEEEDQEYWCPDLSGSLIIDKDGNEFRTLDEYMAIARKKEQEKQHQRKTA